MPAAVSALPRKRPLPRGFFRRDPVELAPLLLNKLFVAGDRTVRIVEVEAYRGADDPGSHAFRGETPRNASMFGPPGHLYVYFTYGMHHCMNVVCSDVGEGNAILLRAAEPLEGLGEMRVARGPAARTDRELCRGPGRLCQALSIDRTHDGADLVTANLGIRMYDDGTPPPEEPTVTTRIGLSAGADRPWRFLVPGSPWVSR
jgi:DNA-3-methyladenine glycosylase